MRIGELQTATVGDVTLGFRLSWGDLKRINRQLQALPSRSADPDAHLQFAEEKLVEHVVTCEGLADAEGKPVEKLTEQVIDDLPPAFVNSAIVAMLRAGEEVGGRGNV